MAAPAFGTRRLHWVLALVTGLALASCQPRASVPSQMPPTTNVGAPAASVHGPSATPTLGPGAATIAATPTPALASQGAWHRTWVADLPWGAAPGQAGRRWAAEQNPEAPMALDVAPDGAVWLLDQVNGRVQRLRVATDGGVTQLGSVQVSATSQDLALTPTDGLWLLDRFVSKSARLVDAATGVTRADVALSGSGVAEPGAVSALWQRGDGLWVEVEHATLVRVSNSAGVPDPVRPLLPGRVAPGGQRAVKALRVPPNRVVLQALALPHRPQTAPEWVADLKLPLPIWAIADVSFDATGRAWVVVDLARFVPGEDAPVERGRMAVAVDTTGREVQRLTLCPPIGPEEQFRTARIGGDGALYSMCRGESGLRIERWAP